MKIGFIDYYLDEWHAENYPTWISEQAAIKGITASVEYAYAEIDRIDGMRNEEWCKKHKIMYCTSVDDVIACSDALIVLSPDHSEHHERLGSIALTSGKPVYIDKTFAPDLASGIRMFTVAEKYGTPLFSSSALRFSMELQPLNNLNQGVFLATCGPGDYNQYAIHQIEMIVAVLGAYPKRVLALEKGSRREFLIEYSDAFASIVQIPHVDFQYMFVDNNGKSQMSTCNNFFPQLISVMLDFFANPDHIVPVVRCETLACIALFEAGRKALSKSGEWIFVDTSR